MSEPKVTLAQLKAAAKAAGFADGAFREQLCFDGSSILPAHVIEFGLGRGGDAIHVSTRRSKQRTRKLMLRVLKGMAR